MSNSREFRNNDLSISWNNHDSMENVTEEYLTTWEGMLFISPRKERKKSTGYTILSVVKLQKEIWNNICTKQFLTMITSPKGKWFYFLFISIFPRSHMYFVIRKEKKNHTITYSEENKFKIRPGITKREISEKNQTSHYNEIIRPLRATSFKWLDGHQC